MSQRLRLSNTRDVDEVTKISDEEYGRGPSEVYTIDTPEPQ